MIASAIFALTAVCFLVHCFYSRSRKWVIEGEDYVSIHEEPSPHAKESNIAEQILKRAGERADPSQRSENQEENQLKTANSNPKRIEEIDIDSIISHLEAFDDDYVEEDEPENRSSDQQPQIFNIDGKSVSLRTWKCMQKLEKDLGLIGKTCGKAIDNGDCFWDAFAQGLSSVLGQQITMKELRQQVSEEIHKLDQGPDKDNWIKKLMARDLMDSYEDYRDHVAYTCDEILERGESFPVWGQERRDGVILCHLYKVNLKVYSVGCIDEDASEMEDEANFYSGEDEFPEGLPYDKTIEIALYPGHFMPVKAKEIDLKNK